MKLIGFLEGGRGVLIVLRCQIGGPLLEQIGGRIDGGRLGDCRPRQERQTPR
jgi:hypothetical protein